MYCFAGGVEYILQSSVVAAIIISKQLFFTVIFLVISSGSVTLISSGFLRFMSFFQVKDRCIRNIPGSRESHESGSFFLPIMHRIL